MPKKPPPRNSFYFYMKDLEVELRREGRVFPHGLADVAPIAGPRWKMLPQKEKDRYENMSKEYKRRMKGAEGDHYKRDNVGNVIGQRKDPYEEIEKRRLMEREQVRSDWPAGKELVNTDFYIIHFNILCKTDEGQCLPCEVGLVEYSMKCGIKKHLHRFIQPGRIPSGYRYQCNEKSESTHQIPVINFEFADENYRGLVIQMENFVNQDQHKESYPPIYCKAKDIEDVELSLTFLYGKAQLGRAQQLSKVYELEGLIVDMYAHIECNMSKSMVSDMLCTNIFDYNPDVQCEWHADKDVKYCSLGIARRITYVISDNLASKYEFALTKKHLPDRSNIADSISIHYQPKIPDYPTPRSYSSSNRTFSQSGSSRQSPAFLSSRPSTASSRQPESPAPSSNFAARDFRLKDGSVSTVSVDGEYDTHSDVTLDTFETRSTTPSAFGPSSSTRHSNRTTPDPHSSTMSGADSGRGRGSITPQPSTALWRKGGPSMGNVSCGVGRGRPVQPTDPINKYPIAPPGMYVRSVIPRTQYRTPGMVLSYGRGFAPDKEI